MQPLTPLVLTDLRAQPQLHSRPPERLRRPGDVPRSASAERRLPAAFRRPRSASAEASPGAGLPGGPEPAPAALPLRLPGPRTPGLVPPLPAAPPVPVPRGGGAPRRGVLGRRPPRGGESDPGTGAALPGASLIRTPVKLSLTGRDFSEKPCWSRWFQLHQTPFKNRLI